MARAATRKLLQQRQKLLAAQQAKVAAAVSRLPPKPITLDPNFTKQNAFIDSTSRFITAQCSRRAGKSSGLAIRFFKAMEAHPKAKCIYASLTFDSAKSIMWPILQEVNEKFNLGCEFREGSLSMLHPNGSSLRLYGADQKNFVKRLKGQKAIAIAVDEAQDFGAHLQSLVDDVLTPMLADYADSWLAITGTPGPIPKGYFYEITQEKKFGFEPHYWTINENPYIPDPEGFIQELIRKKQWPSDYPTLLREWRNIWKQDLESLWIRYKPELNDFTTLPSNVKREQWNHVVGVDLGFRDADAIAVLAWSESDPNIYLVEEIVAEKQGLTPLVNQLKSIIAKYNPHKVIVDPGGGGAKMIEEMRTQHQLPVETALKQEKQQTVEFLNDHLRLGRFKAHANSRFAQDSYLVQIDWERSTPDRIVIKSSPHSDIIDAVIYAYRHSPFWNYQEPKITPAKNSKEYFQDLEKMMFEHHMEKIKKEQEVRDGQGRNWQLDANGIAPWNKW